MTGWVLLGGCLTKDNPFHGRGETEGGAASTGAATSAAVTTGSPSTSTAAVTTAASTTGGSTDATASDASTSTSTSTSTTGGGATGSAFGVWLFRVLRELGQIDLVIALSYLIFLGTVYSILIIWGGNLSGLLAAGGVAGLAVGFAARDTLANLFAGVFILADRPYKVGDFINLDSGERGMVTDIGIRSTRLLTRDDVEITIPNATMGNAKIINESGGPHVKYRVRVKVGVAYESDFDKVRTVLMDIAASESLICAAPEPRVRLRNLGESSVDFELLGWVTEPVNRGRALDNLYMAVLQRFREESIEIPYAKRDLFVKEMPS